MIRRLQEADRTSLIKLLKRAPQLNLYMLGNLEMEGFDKEYCDFFGDVEGERVRAVVNRYMSGWSVYGEANADWAALGALIDGHATVAERLQDNPGGIATLLPYVQSYVAVKNTEETLMELPADGLCPQRARGNFEVRKAMLADLPALVDLYADAGDMARTPQRVERPLVDRRVWVALRGGKAVAAALTNAETSEHAMIGGVYTLPEWRSLGLSQAVCSGLCEELIALGRQPFLYWGNPTAGHVYTKLGFRPIGTWNSVRLARREEVERTEKLAT
jgi:hypothetical protein